MSKVNDEQRECQLGYHATLERIECDGMGAWRCPLCGDELHVTDMMNIGALECATRILAELRRPSGGRFGCSLMNEIVDMFRGDE